MSTRVPIGKLCLVFLIFVSCQKKIDYKFEMKSNYSDNITYLADLITANQNQDSSFDCDDMLKDFNEKILTKLLYPPELPQIFYEDLKDAQKKLSLLIKKQDSSACLGQLYKLHYDIKGLKQLASVAKQDEVQELSLDSKEIQTGDILLIKRVYNTRYINPESYLHQYSDLLVVAPQEGDEQKILGHIAQKTVPNFDELKKMISSNSPLISNITILRPKKDPLKFIERLKNFQKKNDRKIHFLYSEKFEETFAGQVLLSLEESDEFLRKSQFELNEDISELFNLEKVASPFTLQFSDNVEIIDERVSPNIYLDHYVEIFMLYLFKIKDEPRFIHDIRQEYSRVKSQKNIDSQTELDSFTKNQINNEIFRNYINSALEKISQKHPFSHKEIKTKMERFEEFKNLEYPVAL